MKLGDFSLGLFEDAGWVSSMSAILCAKALAGAAIQEASAWSGVPGTVALVQALLQGRAAKLNVSSAGLWVRLAVQVTAMHACFTGADHADLAMRAIVVWSAVNFATMVAVPEHALKVWGKSSPTTEDVLTIRLLGFQVGCYAAALASLLYGNPPATALGHACLVVVAWALDNIFVSKGSEKMGVPLGGTYAWLGIASGVVAFTLF